MSGTHVAFDATRSIPGAGIVPPIELCIRYVLSRTQIGDAALPGKGTVAGEGKPTQEHGY
eukprot:3894528-Rhodomonas_salina.4